MPDTYNLVSYTAFIGDTYPANDTTTGLVAVRSIRHDVGTLGVQAPLGSIKQNDTVAPKAVVGNFGTERETFLVNFWIIGTPYHDTVTTFLLAQQSGPVTFSPWVAESLGHYLVKCSTALYDDVDPADDFVVDSFDVVSSGIEAPGYAPEAPSRMTLSDGAPNPFVARTTVVYGIPKAQPFRLAVYGADGELVQVLASGMTSPGFHSAEWRGTASGEPPGIYFVRLETGGASLIRKIVKLE